MAGQKMFNDLLKLIKDSLKFLENPYILTALIIFFVLYIAGGIQMLTYEVTSLFDNVFVKVLAVLFILYVGVKNVPLAIVLAIAFVLTLQMHYRNRMEGLVTGYMDVAPDQAAPVDDQQLENYQPKNTEKTKEGMENRDGLIGGNYDNYSSLDCTSDCNKAAGPECTGYSKFGPDSLTAQGMNCPVGAYSKDYQNAPF